MIEPVSKDKCLPEILALFPDLIAHRHDIHQHPDCGFETQRTIGKIKEFLEKHNVSSKDMDDATCPGSLFVEIKGNLPGKTIGFRADIDALKMKDNSEKEWTSKIDGHAHACGHDGHQTWLMGAAAYMAEHRDFPGTLVCLFQGAEETGKGAESVVKSGFLDKYNIQEMYAAHDEPFLKKGEVGFKVGHLQAASDSFAVKFIGAGTHGGRPHQGMDPIPALSEMYLAMQTIVSRKVDPLESAVVSVCFMNAGTLGTYNVLPGEAVMGGTVRTFLPEVRDLVENTIKRMAEGIALAHGLKAEVTYERLISSVNNDERLTKEGVRIAQDLLGKDKIYPDFKPFMSSEDFSVYQEKVPGTICRIGISDENHTVPLHNPKFDFNDEVLALASTLFVKIAQERLNALSKE